MSVGMEEALGAAHAGSGCLTHCLKDDMDGKVSLGPGMSLRSWTRLAIVRCPLREHILTKTLLQVCWCQEGGSLLMTPRDAGDRCAFKSQLDSGEQTRGVIQHTAASALGTCDSHSLAAPGLSSWLSVR